MNKLRVLVACERSGVVRSAFRALGHDAWSNDLVPADDGSTFHIQGDAIGAAYSGDWDLIIAHPECTYLANSGAKHLYAGMKAVNGPEPDRWARMGAAAQFFLCCDGCPMGRRYKSCVSSGFALCNGGSMIAVSVRACTFRGSCSFQCGSLRAGSAHRGASSRAPGWRQRLGAFLRRV